VTSTVRDLTAGSGISFERRARLDAPSLDRQVELDAARMDASAIVDRAAAVVDGGGPG
jgi:hypothetical protein